MSAWVPQWLVGWLPVASPVHCTATVSARSTGQDRGGPTRTGGKRTGSSLFLFVVPCPSLCPSVRPIRSLQRTATRPAAAATATEADTHAEQQLQHTTTAAEPTCHAHREQTRDGEGRTRGEHCTRREGCARRAVCSSFLVRVWGVLGLAVRRFMLSAVRSRLH
jgi:hypothetical protein